MDLSKLAPGPDSRKKRKRFGRGEASGHGKTCCRGGKGQTARKSGPVRAGFEGGQMPLYRRLPKMGFVSRQQVLGLNRYNVVNLSVLEQFDAGVTIDQKTLIAAGYAKDTDCKAGLKILGTGNLTKKINVKADAISVSAKAKIESLGGTVEVVS